MNISQNRQCRRPWREVCRPSTNTTQPSDCLKKDCSAQDVDENRCSHSENVKDKCKSMRAAYFNFKWKYKEEGNKYKSAIYKY
jgi:hypothetical protein